VGAERSIHDSPVATAIGHRPAATAKSHPKRDEWHMETPPPKVGFFGRGFYACGGRGLPPRITCLGGQYILEKVLKHDFCAATGIYKRDMEAAGGKPEEDFKRQASNGTPPSRLICKINRCTHFCLLPLGLIGRLVTHYEVRNLRRCEGIAEVPTVLARIGPHMYVYEYIEGKSLNERPSLPADFFDRLVIVLQKVHARNLVHFDLHKPGNIVVDTEGKPHIIDFQISRHIGDRFLLSRRLSSRFRRWLQSYDLYYIYKHKRHLQRRLLTQAEAELSRNHTLGMEILRVIAKPYRKVLRACKRYLQAKGTLRP
jgi:hypothetical protein